MTLRVRALQLRAMTDDGLFGANFVFSDGLVLLRADNSSGKSTCMQAILYGLGLEGMLGATHDVPLPHAMTKFLEHQGHERPVLSSSVVVQVENHKGAVITLERAVKDEVKNRDLILVWQHAVLTGPSKAEQSRPFYVRQQGAATRPDGFHFFLADFLGWKLPLVSRYDSLESPLYLECVFPLMFVEQKHGWTGIQARMPTHLRIREPAKRATEFVLNLQATDALVAVQRLQARLDDLRARWVTLREEVAKAASQKGAMLQEIPAAPALDWPTAVKPQMIFPHGPSWKTLAQEVVAARQAFEEAKKAGVPTVKVARPELENRLTASEERLSRGDLIGQRVMRDLEMEEQQLTSTRERLAALREDLRRNQDAAKLQKMGAVLPQGEVTECPACHRPLADTLLPATTKFNAMTVEANIEFIKEQVATFEALEVESRRLVLAHAARVATVREANSETRSEIRSIKKSLSADERLPSVEAIERLVRLERALEDLKRLRDLFTSALENMSAVAEEFRTAIAERKRTDGGLNATDAQRLRKLETLFREQLREYHFSSVSIDAIAISQDSYRPTHEGFDLGFDLSASDMVRSIWAYLLALLEVARTEDTNHLGLLILDEPRQQETRQLSFQEFLRRAALASAAKQQVIFATSEEVAELRRMVAGVPHTIHAVEGKILKPMNDDGSARDVSPRD